MGMDFKDCRCGNKLRLKELGCVGEAIAAAKLGFEVCSRLGNSNVDETLLKHLTEAEDRFTDAALALHMMLCESFQHQP